MATAGLINLADAAVLEQRKLRKGVIAAIAKASPLASRIPFGSAGGLNVTVVEIEGLPTPSHRLLNDSPGTAKGVVGQKVYGLKIMSDTISIDRQLEDEPNMIQDPMTVQTQLYTRAVAYELADLFINGDAEVTPAEPSGLNWYFANDSRLSGQDIDGGGLEVYPGADNYSDNVKQWLYFIEDAFGRLDDGKPDLIIANRQTINCLSAGVRAEKLLDTTRDQFDRFVRTFQGIPLIDAGVKPAGVRDRAVAQQVISATDAYNEMYFVKWGEEYLAGIQKKPLETINLGISNADPTKRKVLFEWAYNPVCVFNHFGVSRIKNLDTIA